MFQNTHNNTPIIFVVILCFLPLLPWYVAAQESSKRNSSSSGDALTPSTVIIIIMAIIFLFTACLAVFLRRFAHGCFGLHIIPTNYPDSISDDRLATKGGLDADLIKSLPTYLYADVKQHRKLGQVELECAVCLNEFQDPEALRLLPGCSHVFHPRCIDRWLAGHATCPVCRQSLLETESDKQPQHITINITEAAAVGTAEETAAGQEGPSSTEDDNQLEGMEKKRVVGKFSRCHSTGHSIRIMGSAEKYTLELPAEYRYNKKINNNNNNNNNGDRLRRGLLLSASCMASPKSGYNYKCGLFPMTPPLNKTPTNSGSRSFRTLVSSGLFKSSSFKNLAEHAGRQLV